MATTAGEGRPYLVLAHFTAQGWIELGEVRAGYGDAAVEQALEAATASGKISARPGQVIATALDDVFEVSPPAGWDIEQRRHKQIRQQRELEVVRQEAGSLRQEAGSMAAVPDLDADDRPEAPEVAG